MRVLITGASGFVGGHVAAACHAAGDEVRALVRRTSDVRHLVALPGVDLRYGDLADREAVRAALTGVEVVYHVAALATGVGSAARHHAVNVDATRMLLVQSMAAGVRRFVHMSSPSAVMRDEDGIGITEAEPYPEHHLSEYCRTKAAAERIVLRANGPTFTTCALRPRAVWGPRDRHGFLPRLLRLMRAGRLPDLSGGRRVYASTCHCLNAALACVQAGRARDVGGKAYFVTDEDDVDVWAFLAEAAEVFSVPPPGRKVPLPVVRGLARAADVVWRLPVLADRPAPLSRYSIALLTRHATYDTSAARADLAYEPVIGRREGLAELREWVEANGGLDAFLG
ncbi:NAD-dependent epimerase/dehydratase family protein [Lentzea aerocolonigenes]|uniref:NAD-dependent epimerase/dehydratase family protein n=1 Tax=Lentzea aerocolonigenes TaxID=68170 RepID=UPI0005ECA3FA|nr:NAD-dependent epimerase/dehydratase family protein [Lentzea aerocolonigenes]